MMNFPLDIPTSIYKLRKTQPACSDLCNYLPVTVHLEEWDRAFILIWATKKQIKWTPKLCCSARFVCLFRGWQMPWPMLSHPSYFPPRFVCYLFSFQNSLWWTFWWRLLPMGGCGCWYFMVLLLSWGSNAWYVSSGWELSIRIKIYLNKQTTPLYLHSEIIQTFTHSPYT